MRVLSSLVAVSNFWFASVTALQPSRISRESARVSNGSINPLSSRAPDIDYRRTYSNHWENILTEEFQHISLELQEQRRTWSRRRLEQNGISVFGVIAEPDTELFGEKVVRLVKPHTPVLFREKFTRGDVLLMTPTVPNIDPIPRECLVMDVGKDWMSVGVGLSWLPGLWESRKTIGFYQVRLDRMAPQAPLKAQKRALRLLSDGMAGEGADALARIFCNRTEAAELSSHTDNMVGEPDRIVMLRAALEEAKTKTTFQPNISQDEAVIWALQQNIALIRGPAGTGKTRLAAILISTTLHAGDCRVLAVAHSNGAADVLLSALLQMGVPAVRLGRPASVSPHLQHRTAVAMAETLPRMKELRRIIGDLSLDTQSRSSAAYELKKNVMDMQDLIVRSAPVVVTSCIGAHQLFSESDSESSDDELAKEGFSMVVLDEAAQTTEPALVCALVAARAKRVVMVGDTRQLPPTVTHMELRDTLGVSPMARLERAGVQLFTLKIQYRMPPALLLHPSKYFYKGAVASAEQIIERSAELLPPRGFPWPSPSIPLSFVDSGRDNEVTHNFGGKSNPVEASLAVDIAINILTSGELEAGEVAVISPYSKQVQLIRTELLARTNINCPKASSVRVGTIDSFQGQETDLVIISAVRSNPLLELGFLRDSRRLCVAITRSRRGLVILGDRSVLTTCRHWAALIESCDERKCSTDAASLQRRYHDIPDTLSDSMSSFDATELFSDSDEDFYGLFAKE